MNITRTLSEIELIWLLTTFSTSVFAARGLYVWVRENQQRKRDGLNGPLQVFYQGKIRLFTLGLVAFVLCFLLGIAFALSPPVGEPSLSRTEDIATQLRITFGPLIVIALALLFAAALVFDDRDRTLIDRAHDKKAEQRLLTIEAAAKHAALRADHAEKRADNAHVRANSAETRADDAANRADNAETRADKAESRADFAAKRADQAETRADFAAHRADSAETRADFAAERVGQAETRITAEEERSDRSQEKLEKAEKLEPRVEGAEVEIDDHDERLNALEGHEGNGHGQR
ncbi:MAG: hypothetical protein LC793_05125 [Thermomicrobia bacterium]|nr:hypothetical protein [Thermomicrobia bacterium]MCA1724698.1 hypothetical protein [Thermomicrobia bacterium]